MFFSDYMSRFLLFAQLSTVMLLWAVNANDHCPDSFYCGSLGAISFPFTKAGREDCGALAIHGCDDIQQLYFINIAGKRFQVTKVDPWFHTIDIIDQDLRKLLESGGYCEVFDRKITLPPSSHLGYFTIGNKITLFKCKRNLSVSAPEGFLKNTSCGYNFFYAPHPDYDDVLLHSLAACSTVQLPTIFGHPISANLFEFLTPDEVTIQFNPSADCDQCQGHGPDGRPRGRCFLDSEGNFHCDKRKDTISVRMFGLLLLAASSSVVALLLLLACCVRRKLCSQTIRCFLNKHIPTDEVMIERFLKLHGSLPTIRYSYSEIKKATNSFKVKLGQGGYGSVYKGRLQDGRLIAVKILSELKGTGEEFINEVASISRTSHVNIVSLVGFCFQGSKRALVYEFMPNGSLEKFMREENLKNVGQQLDCKTLYDIAIGVAHGLDYLHKGCNTRILHFDIKPHNILLDENFSPKISDFGLAKICPRKESIVSISCARGTIGYIAPEVFSRNFGGVSHKADVYSYGMMVLEMVGRRDNKNVQVDCSSDLYFPRWIYKRLELNQDLGLRCIKNEIDREIVKKMTLVSLWCIQTDPSCHPSMSKVVEMLEGSLESLELPPQPFLRSSPTSLVDYSTQPSETL